VYSISKIRKYVTRCVLINLTKQFSFSERENGFVTRTFILESYFRNGRRFDGV
jgi:hypothetical protein